jgi:hypothetical protein
MTFKKNIFIADDILIKTGYILLIIIILAGLFVWQLVGHQKLEMDPGYNPIIMVVAFALSIMPIAFLIVGYGIRQKEKQYLIVWNILEKTLEVSINDLADNTGLHKETILKALKEINRRGCAFFIYDRHSMLIIDGRLKSQTVAINTCPACGQTLGYTIPLIVSKMPRCKYCGTELDASHVNNLKLEALKLISNSNHSGVSTDRTHRPHSAFNWVVFFILLFVFWPFALVYAYMKNGKLVSR